MKIYTVKAQDGQIREMTLANIIKYKHKGKQATILGVSREIDKSHKGGNK